MRRLAVWPERRLALAALLILGAIAGNACGGSKPVAGAGGERTTAASASIPRSGVFPTSPEHFDQVLRTSEGLPTVVNVWASWCIPCRAETPRFVAAAKHYEGSVRFLGLDTQDAKDTALDFIREFKIPYPSGLDPRGKVARHLKVLGLPTTFFYRPDGKLAFVHSGEISEEDLEEKIEQLVLTSKGEK